MSKFIYMETAKGNGVMRFRGECDDSHDEKSHIKMMGKRGYAIACHASKVGKEVTHNVMVKVRVATNPDEFALKPKVVTHTEYKLGEL